MQINVIDIVAGVPCPRQAMFLFHDTTADRLRFEVFSREDDFLQKENEVIVHMAIISEFSPYFAYLDDSSREKAATAVESLILPSTDLVWSEPLGHTNVVPMALKKLYRRTVSFLCKCAEGCFLTNTFLKKLWNLTYRTWRNLVAYKQWLLPRPLPFEMASELIC